MINDYFNENIIQIEIHIFIYSSFIHYIIFHFISFHLIVINGLIHFVLLGYEVMK